MCLWGRVCVTWHQQLLWNPQLCNFHLHNIASQGCNKRKKVGWWKRGVVLWEVFGGAGGSQGRWGGMGGTGALMVPVARFSFGQIPESRHTSHGKVLSVFSQIFLCSDCYFSFWLKHTGREDSVSQPGLSKQVRGHQHSSEVFSFLFYRGDLHRTHKKRTQAEQEWQNKKKKKKKKEKKQAVPHQSKWICNFWYIFW